MTETQDKIISELMTEVKDLRAQKSRSWISKEMIGIYSAIIAGVLAWGNNYLDDRSRAAELKEESKEDTQVNVRTNNAVVKILLERQNEIEDTCLAYAGVIIESMPAYQKRKVGKLLVESGLEPAHIEADRTDPPRSGRPSSRRGSGSSSHPPEAERPTVAEKSSDTVVEPHVSTVKESIEKILDQSSEQSLYEEIRQQVQMKREVDPEIIKKWKR